MGVNPRDLGVLAVFFLSEIRIDSYEFGNCNECDENINETSAKRREIWKWLKNEENGGGGLSYQCGRQSQSRAAWGAMRCDQSLILASTVYPWSLSVYVPLQFSLSTEAAKDVSSRQRDVHVDGATTPGNGGSLLAASLITRRIMNDGTCKSLDCCFMYNTFFQSVRYEFISVFCLVCVCTCSTEFFLRSVVDHTIVWSSASCSEIVGLIHILSHIILHALLITSPRSFILVTFWCSSKVRNYWNYHKEMDWTLDLLPIQAAEFQ